MGNHDCACFNQRMRVMMNLEARQSIDYTKKILSSESINFLAQLPSYLKEEGIYLVHGLPPHSLIKYLDMLYKSELKSAFASFTQPIVFVGHTHLMIYYELKESGQIMKHSIGSGVIQLNPHSRYIINSGSVGQPMDPNKEAGYLVYDPDNKTIEKRLINYPAGITIQKINDSGLPKRNGLRLLKE